MRNEKQYYEAYDDRYRQVHREKLQWFSELPTPIVGDVIRRFGIGHQDLILEIGCGEGRDTRFLLEREYRVLGTDISPEAVAYCRKKWPEFAGHFQVLDCVRGETDEKFRFIFAVAVVHMLVTDEDRAAFYRFIREHLEEEGIALICTMGDGEGEMASDIGTAFDLQKRRHTGGKELLLAGTSCRMVSWDTFRRELEENGLKAVETGITAAEPDFSVMMYAVAEKG